MNRNVRVILAAAIIIAVLFTGCKDDGLSYEGELKFTGLDQEFSIAYNDIYAMDAVTATVHNTTSEGEERVNAVEGVLLETLLNEHGLSQNDFSSIRLVAGDGYAMEVTADILAEKDIILAYKFDGENLEEKKMPLRAAIDDVRSMYYVSNLAEIQFSKLDTASSADGINKIVLLETVYLDLETQSYTYYESEDEAILAVDLFDIYLDAEPEKVYMIANDGYEKTESYNVLKDGYIKITGEDAPLFTGKDLPIGMNVKYLMNLQTGNVSFASVESASVVFDSKTVNEKEGVPLDELVDMAGLTGEYYILTANDGYSVEVSRNSLADAVVYIRDDGSCAAKFDEVYPKSTSVKYLVSIELGNGENCVTGQNTAVVEEDEEETAAWTITFEGLSDGSFDMTSDKAERKLELVELHTERMKDDVVYPEDWKGYRLLDVLAFLNVEEFDYVTIVAGDGYEVTLDKETIDDETILAVVKNGEALADEDNLVQLVRNTQFATTWVKGVATIIID